MMCWTLLTPSHSFPFLSLILEIEIEEERIVAQELSWRMGSEWMGSDPAGKEIFDRDRD